MSEYIDRTAAIEYGLMPGYVILSLQVPAWDHIWPSACLDGGDTE